MKDNIILRMICFLILSVFICITVMSVGVIAEAKKVEDNVLRLHIVANSNSAEDQEVKLLIRDEILRSSLNDFTQTDNINGAIISARENLQNFEATANEVLYKKGFKYRAKAQIVKSYFPTKSYDNIVLPAGKYTAVKITLGEAVGENWWCMLYPSICVPTAIKDKELMQSDDESLTSKNKTKKAVFRFKIAEIASSILKY